MGITITFCNAGLSVQLIRLFFKSFFFYKIIRHTSKMCHFLKTLFCNFIHLYTFMGSYLFNAVFTLCKKMFTMYVFRPLHTIIVALKPVEALQTTVIAFIDL